MAYTHGNPYRDEVSRVLCDTCAEQELDFSPDGTQPKPWCWVPLWGGLPSLSPEDWDKWGVTEQEALGLCHGCNKPC